MLTLKDFVKETLTEIVDAVAEFSAERSSTGANANPPISKTPDQNHDHFFIGEFNEAQNRYDLIMPVSFDVAVNAADTSNTTKGAGIKVVSFLKADGSTSSETTATAANRVQFTVPLRLPDTGARGRTSPHKPITQSVHQKATTEPMGALPPTPRVSPTGRVAGEGTLRCASCSFLPPMRDAMATATASRGFRRAKARSPEKPLDPAPVT